MTTKLLTSAGAARIADRVPDTIRHWARTGVLPVALQTSSGLRLFDADEVLRVSRQRRRMPRPAIPPPRDVPDR